MASDVMSAVVSATAVAAPAAAIVNGSWTGVSAQAVGTLSTGLTAAYSWINSLYDSVIKTDMTAAAADGSFSYAEAFKLVNDVYGENLTSGKVSAQQFSDLRTIVSRLNDGTNGNLGAGSLGSSSYVYSIETSFTNGSAFNSKWTGGAANAIALGNLAAGTTETQLKELIGKWFAGTDRPSSIVQGDASGTVTYSVTSAPLWGASGPVIGDVNQGQLGDCYLLSSLAEIANNDPALLKSMIVDNGNGTYGVRFFMNGSGTQQWVTVDNTVAYVNGALLGNDYLHGLSNTWVDIVEKAYAELNGFGTYVGSAYGQYGNSFTSMGNGGWDSNVLGLLTGTRVTSAYASSWQLNSIVSALAAHDDVTLDSYSTTTDGAGRYNLISSHAMSITGYDANTGNLVVRNPWGTANGQPWNTTFEVSLKTLQNAGDVISIDQLGTLLPGPQVYDQTAAQSWLAGKAVNFTLASDTFRDPQGLKMTLSASQADGSALPAWLKFNAATGAFTGTPPANAAGFTVKVTATDTAGKTASDMFTVTIPKPPVLANQTASQTWAVGRAGTFALAQSTFSDPQGSALTYTATLADGSPLPSWLKFAVTPDTYTGGGFSGMQTLVPGDAGHFTGTPPANASNLSLRVTATDANGLSVTDVFTLNFAKPPVLANQTGPQNWAVGKAGSFTLAANTFTDPLGSKLTYSANMVVGTVGGVPYGGALPSWIQFNAATNTFTGTPPAYYASNPTIMVTATDSYGLSTIETFTLNLVRPPVLANQTANFLWSPGHAVSAPLAAGTFTDPQGGKLTYTATLSNGQALPSWLKFDPATLTFTGTPPANASGNQTIVVTATDSAGLSTSETFTAVQAKPPVLAVQTAAQSWAVGKAGSFTLAANTFSDPQGLGLTYSATLSNGQPLPSWLVFNAKTATFTGTPPANATALSVVVTANDGYGISNSDTFALNLVRPPVLANQTAQQFWAPGNTVNFALPAGTFSDPQGGKLTYAATLSNGQALPPWLKVDANTGAITGTPPANSGNVGNIGITITATNAYGLSASETFTDAQAKAPVLANQTADVQWAPGRAFSATLAANTFIDPQGAKHTYSATLSNGQALPSWIKVDAATGSVSGTPPSIGMALGNQSFTVTAKDSYGLSASETFTATLAAPTVANPLTNGTQVWTAGQTMRFGVAANTFKDPFGSALTYSASVGNGQALPSTLKFDATTATFSGLLAPGSGPVQLNVTATDAYGLSSSVSFSVSQPAKGPVLQAGVSQTQSYTVSGSSAFSISIAGSASNATGTQRGWFSDTTGNSTSVSLTQWKFSGDADVSSWLSFDAKTMTLNGKVPTGASGVAHLELDVTDGSGAANAPKAAEFIDLKYSNTSGLAPAPTPTPSGSGAGLATLAIIPAKPK